MTIVFWFGICPLPGMKNLVIAVLAIFFGNFALAQKPILHHYRSGQLSCRETFEGPNEGNQGRFRTGKVEVFSRKGELVFEGHRRTFAGHASVDLSFHPNGGVSTIKVSEAPDAGIQWYKAEYTLDTDGNIVNKWETGHDDRTYFPNPGQKIRHEEMPPTSAPAACAVPIGATLVVHNRASKVVEIRLKGLTGEVAGREYLQKLAVGDSLVSHELVNAQRAFNPEEMFEFFMIDTQTRLARPVPFSQIPMRKVATNPQHMRYELFWVDGL